MKAIIFDMDGVIIDGEPAHLKSTNRVLTKFGHRRTAEENKPYIGTSAVEYWSRTKAHYNLPESVETLIKMKIAYLEEEYVNASVIPGFLTFFNKVSSHGCKIAIASSSSRGPIKSIVKRLKLENKIHAIASSDECAHGKPYPDVYLLAAKRLGVEPKDCVAIEDSMNGVLSAKRAGMFVIAVPTEYTEDQDLSSADVRVTSLANVRLETLGAIR